MAHLDSSHTTALFRGASARLVALLLVPLLGYAAGCGGPPPIVGGGDAGVELDAGLVDAGSDDAGSVDAGFVEDAGIEPDAGFDAGDEDAGWSDAGDADGGVEDAGEGDAGWSDAGSDDAGSTDAGSSDAGSADAGVDGGDTWPAPETTILTSPSANETTGAATFTFEANDPRHTFQCNLDAAAWTTCTSPAAYTGLTDGQHTFEVRAVAPDQVTVDETPASFTWQIELSASGQIIRIMAANTTSGNLQSYSPGHGKRIFQGLQPDIVLIQEFNYESNSTADLRAFVDDAFGPEFHFSRQNNVQIPNGIISRFPIIESGIWDDPQIANREFNWARIDIPGPVDLWAVSVHLLTSSASVRNTEAKALVAAINANVPAGDYLVLGGDFNTDNRTEACISTFSQVVVTSNTLSPWPVDKNGNSNTNASRSKPYDWVLADPDLAPLEVPLKIGSNTFNNGLVFDSRVYTPLSEVAPVQSGDSGASNMQHMAVMKAFRLP